MGDDDTPPEDLAWEHYLADIAYTRQVAAELRMRFLLARTKARQQRIEMAMKEMEK